MRAIRRPIDKRRTQSFSRRRDYSSRTVVSESPVSRNVTTVGFAPCAYYVYDCSVLIVVLTQRGSTSDARYGTRSLLVDSLSIATAASGIRGNAREREPFRLVLLFLLPPESQTRAHTHIHTRTHTRVRYIFSI